MCIRDRVSQWSLSLFPFPKKRPLVNPCSETRSSDKRACRRSTRSLFFSGNKASSQFSYRQRDDRRSRRQNSLPCMRNVRQHFPRQTQIPLTRRPSRFLLPKLITFEISNPFFPVSHSISCIQASDPILAIRAGRRPSNFTEACGNT